MSLPTPTLELSQTVYFITVIYDDEIGRTKIQLRVGTVNKIEFVEDNIWYDVTSTSPNDESVSRYDEDDNGKTIFSSISDANTAYVALYDILYHLCDFHNYTAE